MLIHFYILIEVTMLACFFSAFFTRKLLFWTMSAIFSGVLMMASFNVYHTFLGMEYSHPYMLGFNLMFFGLSLFYAVVDFYDQFGTTIEKGGGK